jgi:hypothetical protein
MSELLAWALHKARQQTFLLVEDLPEEQMCAQTSPGENHPAWILGHLLLGDIYLLSMLQAQELSEDFPDLLSRYGPGTIPKADGALYDAKAVLVERLVQTDALRVEAIRQKTIEDLSQPTPDEVLVQAQPTIGHHLQTLVFHEGHHGGQLSSWRKAQGLGPIRGAFAPKGF